MTGAQIQIRVDLPQRTVRRNEVYPHVRPRAQRERIKPRVSARARVGVAARRPRARSGFLFRQAAHRQRSDVGAAEIRRRRLVGYGGDNRLHANHVRLFRKRAQQPRGNARLQPSRAGVVYGDAMPFEKSFGVRNIARRIDGYRHSRIVIPRRRIVRRVCGHKRPRAFPRRRGDAIQRRREIRVNLRPLNAAENRGRQVVDSPVGRLAPVGRRNRSAEYRALAIRAIFANGKRVELDD